MPSTYIRRVGFDKMISIGNMSDVDFADLIEWLDQDASTECISLYIEGIGMGAASWRTRARPANPSLR